MHFFMLRARAYGTYQIPSLVGYRANPDITERRIISSACLKSSPDSLAIQPEAKFLF
jgi:hypothetical protein